MRTRPPGRPLSPGTAEADAFGPITQLVIEHGGIHTVHTQRVAEFDRRTGRTRPAWANVIVCRDGWERTLTAREERQLGAELPEGPPGPSPCEIRMKNALPPSPDTRALILTVGLPRSGKTTWALETGHPIVNPDAIRVALHGQRFLPEAEPMVWTVAKYMVRSLFLAGHEVVIVDATNTTRQRRLEWVSPTWSIYYQVFDTPAEECIRRARALDDEEIVPIIERMAARFEPPADPRVEAAADGFGYL